MGHLRFVFVEMIILDTLQSSTTEMAQLSVQPTNSRINQSYAIVKY